MNKKIRFYTFNMHFVSVAITRVNRLIELLKTDKTKYMITVIILAMFIAAMPQSCFADGIAVAGEAMLSKIQMYMAIVISIVCSIEISTELLKGGRGYTQIIFKYGGGYIALIIAPMIFEAIKNIF